MKNAAARVPTLDRELSLYAQGYRLIAGLDEAGRGAWAGPVVAAAVILPLDTVTAPELVERLTGVRDSKQMTPRARDRCFDLVRDAALAVGVGAVAPACIDRGGLIQATRQAMQQALRPLRTHHPPEHLLLDALALPAVPLPQLAFPKADAQCLTVAAASIIAKVTRDRLMVQLDRRYPGYHFARHKGYGTAAHRAALQALGPCPIHRFSYAPVRQAIGVPRLTAPAHTRADS